MIDDKLISSLSEDERLLLLKLYAKITEAEYNKLQGTDDIHYHEGQTNPSVDETIEHIEYEAIHQYDEIQNGGSLLDSPVELVFNVNCSVFEKNNSGEIVNHNELFIKTYHVPLANQNEIKEYIEAFFRKFTSTLENTAKEVIN
jgi:hypothetical protein